MRLTFASVEDTDASVATVVNFVAKQMRVGVGFDPDSCHCVIEDLVITDLAQAAVVDENAAILTAPDLVALNRRVTTGSIDNK